MFSTRKIISITINPKFHEAMKVIQAEERINISGQVELALEHYLDSKRPILRKYEVYLPHLDAKKRLPRDNSTPQITKGGEGDEVYDTLSGGEETGSEDQD